MADTPLTLTSTLGFFYKESHPILRSFLSVFFPNFFVTEQTQIQVDRFTKGRTRAFYRPLGGSANLMSFTNGTSIMYQPPAIGLKTPISEELAQSVTVGISANNSQNEHTLGKIAMIQDEQSNKIMTEIVLQACEVLRTGAFTAKTEDNQPVGTFDFTRDSSLSFSYHVGNKGGFIWLQEMWTKLLAKRCPSQRLVVLVGRSFMSALIKDAEFQKYVNTINFVTTNPAQGGGAFQGSEVLSTVVNIMIPGTAVYCNLISFEATYDVAGTETPFIPDDEAVMTSLISPRTTAFAGITIADVASGNLRTYSGEMVSDKFVQNDPDGIYIRTQSRPLLIPGNINHVCRVIGTNF